MTDRPRDRLGRPLPRGSRDELAGREDPDDAEASAAEAAARAMDLFDAGRFFEAHEWFESLWKRSDVPGADRRFWRGLTQVAAGCCHLERGNLRGGAAVLERGASNLDGYPVPHHGLDTAATARAARALGAAARASEPGPWSFPRLPRAGGPDAGTR